MNAIRTAFPIFGFWDTRQGGRAENQDSCGFVDSPHGLIAVVCDGMGGGPAGKEASILAVQTIADYFSNQPVSDDLEGLMRNAVEHANQAIITKAKDHQEMRGMGSTVVAVLFHPKAAVVAHVGDSRVYQFRQGNKVFRTEDHSLVAEMVRSKELTEEQARLSGQTNVITKALGGKNGHLVDVEILPYERGDRFLLCTDGIWNALSEKDLITRAAQTPSLAGAVDSIVLQADELGRKNGNTHDNLTLALFETKQDSITKVKMNRKAIKIIRALTFLCVVCLLAIFVMAVNLLKPNVEKELLEQSKMSLAKKNEEVKELRNKIDSLEKALDNSKKKVYKEVFKGLNEKPIVENGDEQSDVKEKEDANKKEKSPTNDVDKKEQLSKEIDGIITNLKKVVKAIEKKEREERTKQLKEAAHALNSLSLKDKSHAELYKSIIKGLNEEKTQKSNSDEVKKRIKNYIDKLEKIK